MLPQNRIFQPALQSLCLLDLTGIVLKGEQRQNMGNSKNAKGVLLSIRLTTKISQDTLHSTECSIDIEHYSICFQVVQSSTINTKFNTKEYLKLCNKFLRQWNGIAAK